MGSLFSLHEQYREVIVDSLDDQSYLDKGYVGRVITNYY